MTTLALGLVLLSAIFHATWNLFAKRAGGAAVFVWLADAISCVVYLPLAVGVLVLEKPDLGPVEIGFMFGSALLHLGYFLALLRGYRVGDLSLVYPLARGTGPVISTLGAILLFSERPAPLALLGALMIAGGAFLLTGGPRVLGKGGSGWAIGYGLITGVLIGAYTLWDKFAVATLLIPPLLQYYGSSLGRVVLLAPYISNRREEIAREWRTHRLELFAVGLLSPVSYILVLVALTFTLVSYVAPAREISILLGAIMGARLLSEGDATRRLIASSAMVAGVVALALS
ncbi:MAG: DMT family transporter [Chloroflexota bacterium]